MSTPTINTAIQVWDDLHNERAGYFRAFWTKDSTDTLGCPCIGYCSPGGSHRTIRAVVDEIRRTMDTSTPIYRNGRCIDKGTP